MADQKTNAGNIGDVVKHALLAEMVWSFGQAQNKEWIYCETHAGFYDYDLALLKDGQEWKGERAWSVGIVEQSGQILNLGRYGAELATSLKNNVYPGSIRIVDHVTKGVTSLKRICGWDICDEQVQSYSGKSGRISVSKTRDGYAEIGNLSQDSKLIFCDPFWTDPGESKKAKQLLGGKSPVIVWYSLSKNTKEFREWVHRQNLFYVELQYRNYQGGDGWGRDMQGAGLVSTGLPETAIAGAQAIGRALKAMFEGKRHPGTPRKKKGVIRVPPDRELSLRLTLSF
jgi:23S rRNA A2030 N6-methylase RlmJ